MSLAVSPSMSEGSRGKSVAWGGVIRRPGHTSQWNSGRWVTDTRTPDYGGAVAQRVLTWWGSLGSRHMHQWKYYTARVPFPHHLDVIEDSPR